jgi:hypothetical protein
MDIKFPIRPPLQGDRLIKYEYNYDNSVEAIRAVNFRLPSPMLKDCIIVIQLNIRDEAGVPTYQVES